MQEGIFIDKSDQREVKRVLV